MGLPSIETLSTALFGGVAGLTLWAALALVAGGVLGECVQRLLGWPRIVGYSVVGMLLAFVGLGVGSRGLDGPLRLVVDLALALLLFELGARVNLRWLKANPWLMATGLLEAVLTFALVATVLLALDFSPKLALVCATLMMCSSGAVVGRVASEVRAAGQVTERMIVLTAINTLFAVVAHKFALGWLHLDDSGQDWGAVLQILYIVLGSAALAYLLARLIAFGARRLDLRDENVVLMLLGVVVLSLAAARLLELSSLLVPLMAGVWLRNSTQRPWVWPRHFGTAGGVLVLMLFIIVGSAWTVSSLVAGLGAAVLVLAVRALAKTAAVVALARPSGMTLKQGLALSLTLMPVSGTTLVLLTDLQLTHPAFALAVAPMILASIALMEVLGPIAVQGALRATGDAHPLTANRREVRDGT